MTSQPTQQTQAATQPFADPRRQARTLSEMSENDAADIICVLHANSPMAARAVRATMLTAPEHVLQNDDLDGVTEDDLELYPEIKKKTREIALRMSSTVKLPKEGFRFGRNAAGCDILLTENFRDKLVSNIHFKIFVHEQGSLMIQDCSTNGTIVDDEILKSKDRGGRPLAKPGKRVLRNGSIITVLVGVDKDEIKLMVRIPNRTDYEALYEEKLRRYLAIRGIKPNFSSVRESSFGNHWSGGSTYNFTGLLGKGAFATVYRVQTKSEGTVYAAKEIDKRRFIKNGILDVKFDNELQIMRKLKHPNIVDYVDCQAHESWIYIIMEFVPYGELSNELSKRGRLPEHEVQQITKQTLRALDYLHMQGITHRDIKPDNILISSREPLSIKLSDFGLSKSVIDEQTFLKTFCGTLLYCAPEVYPDYNTYAQPPSKRRRHSGAPVRTAPYDSSADMWSFGAVIFHLMAGKAPIIGRGENGGAQMLRNIMTQPVDFGPLREVGISEAAIDFINALLNRQPALRPTEQECFQHLWLKAVPDVLDYSEIAVVDLRPRGPLEDVEEGDEDLADEELINDLQRLTQNPEMLPVLEEPPSTPSSPVRPIKKPKMTRDESTIPEHILYPQMASASSQRSTQTQAPAAPKLFGEITPSILKSSGLFGIGQADVSAPRMPDMPQIQDRLEQVSMNDWAKSNADHHLTAQDAARSMLEVNDISYAAKVAFAGSAASLMGAERELDQMNMGSPEAAFTDAPTPETNNPITPQTRNMTPVHSVTRSGGELDSSLQSFSEGKSRHIDVNLLADEVAFAEEQRLRQAAREENARLRAQTFHVQNDPRTSTNGAAVTAKTFSAPVQRTMQVSTNTAEQSNSSTKTQVLRQLNTNTFGSTPEIFGRLVPLEGSFDQTPIPLASRSTLWGRAPQCNCRYADMKDARVPKFGLKIVFYAPGIEAVENDGGDWTKVPRVRTIIATSATRGIKINGMRLLQESEDGKAALFGKLYSGDVITIVENDAAGGCLKYRVEILFGDSAQQRPEKEQPFVIQREYNHHARMKEQSMHVATAPADDESALMPAADSGVAVA